jgi:peptide/nickel transport system permease protein
MIMATLPGDPALAILGPYATPESLATLRRELGLHQPLWQRFFIWLGHVVQGDFGRSVSLQRPVIDEIAERIGPTLLLAAAALALSVALGLATGLIAAAHERKWQDRVFTLVVLVGISTPQFWLGLLLILVFGVWLGWLPVSGMFAAYGGGGLADLLQHLVLPAASLAVVVAGVLARLTRTVMLEELSQDYVRMARAKGLSARAVLYRHAFRNALPQLVPVIGLQAGFVLGGAVYIETVFQWPGLGRMLVDAISTRDLLLVQGGVLVMASAYVLVNLVADVAQHWLDPRIRLE